MNGSRRGIGALPPSPTASPWRHSPSSPRQYRSTRLSCWLTIRAAPRRLGERVDNDEREQDDHDVEDGAADRADLLACHLPQCVAGDGLEHLRRHPGRRLEDMTTLFFSMRRNGKNPICAARTGPTRRPASTIAAKRCLQYSGGGPRPALDAHGAGAAVLHDPRDYVAHRGFGLEGGPGEPVVAPPALRVE